MIYAWILQIPDIIQGISGNPKICGSVRPSMDKLQEGLKKLKQIDVDYDLSHLNDELNGLNNDIKEIQSKVKNVTLTKVGLTVAFLIVISFASMKKHK
jgi:hypothetical protein